MKNVYKVKIISYKSQRLEFKFHDAINNLDNKITQGHYGNRMLQINLSQTLNPAIFFYLFV